MHKLVTLIAAAALLAVCLAPAAPNTSDQATADVTLTIEQYAWIEIQGPPLQGDPLEMTVYSSWLAPEHVDEEHAYLDVAVFASLNFPGLLTWPAQITLTNHGSYTATADVTVTVGGVGENPENPGSCPLDPGVYDGDATNRINLHVATEHKKWTTTDAAGTYSTPEGEPLTLTITPQT